MVTRTWRTAHTFQNTPVPPGTASVFSISPRTTYRFDHAPRPAPPSGAGWYRRPRRPGAARKPGLGPRPPLSCATARRGRPEAYPKVRPHPKKVTPHPP